MAYTTTNLTTLAHLKALAEKSQSTYATQSDISSLQTIVENLENSEENIIESVSVNGTALTITDKNVDITIPTAVSELTNDSNYQTDDEVASAIATAISESGHASYQIAEAVPSADEASENVMYLVMNSDTGYYDIYLLISGSMVRIDDTSVDLTDYATTEYVDEALGTVITSSDIATDDEVSEILAEIFA